MSSTISLLTEIPESLHTALAQYLEEHPDWDHDRVLTAALSLFLMQNGKCHEGASRVYLATLFQEFQSSC
jgi:predicted TPR repeat methyltransferase